MPHHKGFTCAQNNFLDTIATRFDGTHSNFVLGNAQTSNYPIVYCSDGFIELTGWPRSYVMSKSCSCNFLWGENTTASTQNEIMTHLDGRTDCQIQLELYRKDGSSFLCLLDIVPIKNEKDQIVLFLVSHKNLSEQECNGQNQKSSDLSNENQTPSTDQYKRRRSRAVLYQLSGQYNRKKKRRHLVFMCLNWRQMTGDGGFCLNRRGKRRGVAKGHPEDLGTEVAGGYYEEADCLGDGEYVGGGQEAHSSAQQHPGGGGARSNHRYNGRQHPRHKKRCLVLHYSLFKIVWDWLILLCTFYIAVFVPYNVVFLGDRHFIVFDTIVELLFITDICLNFRTTYVNKAGQVVYNPLDIARNYMFGWFLLDMIAAIPFDVLSNMHFQFGSVRTEIQMMKLARLLRLLRLMQKIERYAQYSCVLLALLVCAFVLCAHWMACIWYLIGQWQLKSNQTQNINWLYDLSEKINAPYFFTKTPPQSVGNISSSANISLLDGEGLVVSGGPDLRSVYITSLYFTCTSITSVGFGNVSPNTDAEKIFSICSMMVGALMHAAIFGNVTAIIQRMYSRKTAYQTKSADLKDFVRVHRLPRPLKHRMLEYFQTNWAINRGIDPHSILRDFPEELRGEISLHLHKEMLCLSMFHLASNSCRKSVAQHVKTMFATPGEFLLRKGDAIKYLYLVCSGSLEIMERDETVVALLGKFDLFGPDVGPFPPTRCGFEVRALTYCELQSLRLECLTPLFDQYPEFARHFRSCLLDELTYNISEPPQQHNYTNTTIPIDPEDQTTSDYIYLPAISERVEEEDQELDDYPNQALLTSEDAIFFSPCDNEHAEHPPANTYSSAHHQWRRRSHPQPSSARKSRPRSSSLPLNQLDQLSHSNVALSAQIQDIQLSVDRLADRLQKLSEHLLSHQKSNSVSFELPHKPRKLSSSLKQKT